MMPSAEQALEMYRALVEDNEQAVPALALCYPSGVQVLALELPEGTAMADVVDSVTEVFCAEQGRPQWAVLSSEAWFQHRVTDDLPLAKGDLERLRTAGDPTVSEAVLIWAVDASTDWVASFPFVRSPVGVEWLPATVDMTGATGAVQDALRAMVRGT